MKLRYFGEFLNAESKIVRVEIFQKSESPYTPKEVYFASARPVEVEWSKIEKYTPVQYSCATIILLSKNDREFIDLYTVEVGTIKTNIYIDGALYWSGMLDPELYEEPYSKSENYEVSITFSDFAILKRFYFDFHGFFYRKITSDRLFNSFWNKL